MSTTRVDLVGKSLPPAPPKVPTSKPINGGFKLTWVIRPDADGQPSEGRKVRLKYVLEATSLHS